jgi:hypothetical protein
MRTTLKTLCVGGALAVAALLMGTNTSQAQYYPPTGAQTYPGYAPGGSTGYTPGYASPGYSGYRSGPIYHGPSVHYDRVYHADRTHWTPGRGLHTHGHYDAVPHYTPGHFDRSHGGHVDLNPRYHR